MKKSYMVEFELPDPMPMEFIQQIPAQRNMINYMMAEGEVKAYSLALDRSKLWAIMIAETEFDLMEKIAQLPLSDYLIPNISELAFHNSSDMILQFSLN